VYRARDTRLGRDVAIKILPSEFTHHPERLRRFEPEALTEAMQVSSPGSFGSAGFRPFGFSLRPGIHAAFLIPLCASLRRRSWTVFGKTGHKFL